MEDLYEIGKIRAIGIRNIHPDRVMENFNISNFELSADDMDTIGTLDMKKSSFFDHRDPEMVK